MSLPVTRPSSPTAASTASRPPSPKLNQIFELSQELTKLINVKVNEGTEEATLETVIQNQAEILEHIKLLSDNQRTLSENLSRIQENQNKLGDNQSKLKSKLDNLKLDQQENQDRLKSKLDILVTNQNILGDRLNRLVGENIPHRKKK